MMYNALNRDTSSYKYTPEELEYLKQTLKKGLGPEFLSTRPGPAGSGKLTYIDGNTALSLANDVFGFNGWSSSVVGVTVDFVDVDNGRVSLGLSAVIRITLKDGTYHEDIGYGSMENSKSKASAYEKAKKEAVTDGIKRALRYFGNLMGNCLYDKKFCKDITKVPNPPQLPIKVETLYRKPQVTPQQALSRPSPSSELPNTTKATSFLNDNSKGSGANVVVLETEINDEFEVDDDDDEFSRMVGIYFDEGLEVNVNVTPASWDKNTMHRNSPRGGSDKKILRMPPPQGLVLETFVSTTGATANQQQSNGNKLSMPWSLGPQGQNQGYRPQPPVLNSTTGGVGPNGKSALSLVKQPSSVGGPALLASISSGVGNCGPNGGSGVRQPCGGAPASAGLLESIPSGTGSGDVMVSNGIKRLSSMDNIGAGVKAASSGGGADRWFHPAVETVNTDVVLCHGNGSIGAIKRLKQG